MTSSMTSTLRFGSDAEIGQQLGSIASKFSGIADEIRAKIPRTEQSLAVQNLSRRFAHELSRLERLRHEGIDLVAWCTRNAFELNLLVRYVLLSNANAGGFLAESGKDEQQILEGFRKFANEHSASARAVVEARISEIDRIAAEHGVALCKPPPTAELARLVQCEEEYIGLFKFMSKYVHPSSWLVNRNTTDTHNGEYWNVLVILAQMYALDALKRVGDKYGIAVELPPTIH